MKTDVKSSTMHWVMIDVNTLEAIGYNENGCKVVDYALNNDRR